MRRKGLHTLGPKVSLLIQGKPYLFRSPNYSGIQKELSQKNILKLSQEISKQIIIGNQNHGANVIVIDKHNSNAIQCGDALLTTLPNVAICVLASDCVPIMLHDRTLDIVGVIHAGRKGLEQGIISQTIQTLITQFNSHRHDITVFIGPCISQKNYQLGESEIQFFKQDYGEYIIQSEDIDNRYYLDIRNIARSQLIKSGLKYSNIIVSGDCTYEKQAIYHSFRRHTHTPELEYGNNLFGIWKNT